jgi:hypothetical protein
MRYRSRFATFLTGKRWPVGYRFTECAFIFNLLPEFGLDFNHFIIIVVQNLAEHSFRAGFYAPAIGATQAFIRVYGDEIFPTPIQISIICFHKLYSISLD